MVVHPVSRLRRAWLRYIYRHRLRFEALGTRGLRRQADRWHRRHRGLDALSQASMRETADARSVAALSRSPTLSHSSQPAPKQSNLSNMRQSHARKSTTLAHDSPAQRLAKGELASQGVGPAHGTRRILSPMGRNAINRSMNETAKPDWIANDPFAPSTTKALRALTGKPTPAPHATSPPSTLSPYSQDLSLPGEAKTAGQRQARRGSRRVSLKAPLPLR